MNRSRQLAVHELNPLAGMIRKAHFPKPGKPLPLDAAHPGRSFWCPPHETPLTQQTQFESYCRRGHSLHNLSVFIKGFKDDLGRHSSHSLSPRMQTIIATHLKHLQEGSQYNLAMKWKGYTKRTVNMNGCYTQMNLHPSNNNMGHC